MLRAGIQTVATFAVLAASLFVSAGRMDWPAAWVSLLGFGLLSIAAFRFVDPSLIRERSKLLADADWADTVLASAVFVLLYPGELIVCGLDFRFGGSPALPVALQLSATAVVVAGYACALWAMRVNRFFATAVKLQPERGHQVVDRGPYAWVRHPGYAGTAVAHLALPAALGTLAGVVPAVAGVALLGLRAVREERLLMRELAGYPEYARRVRWRFVPGGW
jgi:protein-S-isoprenylcysteine O-methyltransferase Ste14